MLVSGLNDQEQWQLLNASAPLKVLADMNAAQAGPYRKDAPILTSLQNGLLRERIEAAFGMPKQRTESKEKRNDDGTLYDWNKEIDNKQVQPFPFQAPVPVIKQVPYPPNGEKAYVFFTNSWGARFKKQALYQQRVLESQGYDVELVQTDDVDIFMREWNDMDPKTTTAVVISHCNGMSLIFEDNSKTNAISATGFAKDKKTKLPAISELSGPEIAELYIYACNAGHEELLANKGTNVADAFRDLSSVDTVYAFDGSVSFGPPALFRTTFEPRLSHEQSYDDVFAWFQIPGSYGESGASGLLEYDSED